MNENEMNVAAIFGSNVQRYRKSKELTQEHLATKLEISQKHLSDIENGTKFASSHLIEKLSEVLAVSPSMLFGGSDALEISNKVAELMFANLYPKLQILFNDMNEIKMMLQNMNITVNFNDNKIKGF